MGIRARINVLPVATRFLVRHAALAHPCVKTPLFERILGKIAKTINEDATFETNMGISPHLRCKLPLAKTTYLFGRPHNNVSERATCELVKQLSVDCAAFLDVGAHEGLFTFSVYAFRKGKIDIHFFEPDKDLYERLIKNIAANHIRAHGNEAAVARQSGRGTFFKNLDDDLSGSLTNYFGNHRTRPEPVKTISLDDYFASEKLDKAIVKIDVEGAGSDVWFGAGNVITKIEYLVIEIIGPEARGRLPFKIISQTGLQGYYIRDFDLIYSERGEFTYVAPFWNWLFCKLTPVALGERLLGTKFQVMAAPQT
jgi:FkbM family methyltransferase